MSNTIANLETTLGVVLFGRSGWRVNLTTQGHALLANARGALLRTDRFKSSATGLPRGLKAELSIVFDMMFPAAWVATCSKR